MSVGRMEDISIFGAGVTSFYKIIFEYTNENFLQEISA